MLYIIGSTYVAQVKEPNAPETDAQKALSECLRKLLNEVRLDFIAEEWREELSKRWEVYSIAKDLADQNGIAHTFCDPTDAERAAVGCQDIKSLLRW